MPDTVTYITVERKPLVAVESDERQKIKVRQVAMAVKKGIEVQIGSTAICDPDADCWFAVTLEYDWRKRNGATDHDTIITQGTEFFLARRDLGDTKLVLNEHARHTITKAIERFAKTL